MYFTKWALNVKVINNTGEVLRGIDLTFLEDLGRHAHIPMIKNGESKVLVIATEKAKNNSFILKTRNGVHYVLDCEIVENPENYMLNVYIDRVDEHGKLILRYEYDRIDYKTA